MMTKTDKFIKKWRAFNFNESEDAYTEFMTFLRDFRAVLREQATVAGYKLHSFNKMHYECSAVLQEENTGAFAYISIPDVRFFRGEWSTNVLYRQMKHAKDWTGGANHFTTLDKLGENLKTLYR